MTRKNIHQLFSDAAKKFSQHTAIESEHTTITYHELEESSNKLATFLMAKGAQKGDIVAFFTQDTIYVTIAIIGILKMGGVFVPLDPNTPEERLKIMVSETNPKWLLTEFQFAPSLDTLETNTAIIYFDKNASGIHDASFLSQGDISTAPQNIQSNPDDMCYIYFTSGSTGKPKGIAGRLKAIDHFISWEINALDIQEGTRVSQFTSPSFDAFLRDIFVPLCAGGTICVPDKTNLLTADKLIEWINDYRINLIHCVPSLFRTIIGANPPAHYFSTLQYILLAGERLHPSDIKKWVDIYGERVQLVNLYGPSETTMVKFCYFVKPTDATRRIIPIGQPIPGTKAIILDEQMRVCDPNMIGEIYIRTPFRSLGYYNQPALTDEVFIQNPFNDTPGDIIYKTGDLGRVSEDNVYEFIGRKDHQVKIRGVRVELGEIEFYLHKHPIVQDVVLKDWYTQDNDVYLCAYIVSDEEIQNQVLSNFLLAYLPENMIPSFFVHLPELPKSLNGKINRKALPDPQKTFRLKTDYLAPRNEIEKKILQCWQKVLDISQIGVNDNFFELGGHSLKGMRLLSLLNQTFQIELPLRTLFEATTIASLALMIIEKKMEQVDKNQGTALLTEIKNLSSDEVKMHLAQTQQKHPVVETGEIS